MTVAEHKLILIPLIMVIGLGLCPVSKAQVSCSPKVQVRKCKEVAELLDGFLKLETIGERGPGVQLELVSPAEYKVQVNQIKKDLLMGPIVNLNCAPDFGSEKLLFHNCTLPEVDVLFLRNNSSDLIPKHLLVSSDEASDVFALLYFVKGYFAGLEAEMAESQSKR